MSLRLLRLFALALPVLATAPGMVEAQSLLAGSGLGLSAEPLDARARSLGGAGTGLSGWYLLPTDPAAAAGLTYPSVTGTYEPTRATLSDGRTAGTARFPVLGASYPLRGNVFWIQLSSFLDQELEVRTSRVLTVSGAAVRAEDVFRSTGGIGQVQIGWSRRLPASLAVGLGLGSYTGTVERTFARAINPEDLGPDVEAFLTQVRWKASGKTAVVGVAWDPSPLLRISSSAAWSGDLVLTPNQTGETEGSYAIPLELRLGANFSLSSDLAVAAGVSYADWSETTTALGEPVAEGAAWSYGGGVEWSGASLLDRAVPLRLGVRRVDLPFQFEGEEISEQVFSGGFGLHFLEAAEGEPLARLEVGFEKGSRSGGVISEKFTRTTITVRVAGN